MTLMWQWFLGKKAKVQATKEKIDKLDYINTSNLHASKDTTNGVRMQPTEWEKYVNTYKLCVRIVHRSGSGESSSRAVCSVEWKFVGSGMLGTPSTKGSPWAGAGGWEVLGVSSAGPHHRIGYPHGREAKDGMRQKRNPIQKAVWNRDIHAKSRWKRASQSSPFFSSDLPALPSQLVTVEYIEALKWELPLFMQHYSQ